MRDVILVCYYFPPLLGIASERAAALARHLPEHGWRPLVVAPRSGHFHRDPRPEDGDRDLPADVKVVRTTNPEISRLIRRMWGKAASVPDPYPASSVAPVEAGAAGGRMREWVRRYLYVPDAQVGWIPFAGAAVKREARALLATGSTPVVFSSSVPYSAHLAAATAARRLGLPWVAEFRDPWTTRPGWSMGSLRENLDRRLERDLVRMARAVVVPTRSVREDFIRAHDGLAPDRVHVVRNGFEPEARGTPPGPAEPLRLVYTGTLYDPGHAAPLVRALAELNSLEEVASAELDVLGPPAPWSSVHESVGHPAWLRIHGMKTPAEARAAVASSSATVLLHPTELHRHTLPGKLFEYLGARRPVLAAIPMGSEMQELLDAHGEAWFMEPYDVGTARTVLEALLRRHMEGALQGPAVEEGVVAALSRRAQVRIMAAVLASAGDPVRASAATGPAPPRRR